MTLANITRSAVFFCVVQVGSRRVVQTGAVILLILGMLGKFGAIFVSIPTPIVGGVFMVMFGKFISFSILYSLYIVKVRC